MRVIIGTRREVRSRLFRRSFVGHELGLRVDMPWLMLSYCIIQLIDLGFIACNGCLKARVKQWMQASAYAREDR